MGLFKWSIKLGEYGDVVADGYGYARRIENLYWALNEKYNNEYHNIIIEEDWIFDEEDTVDVVDVKWEDINGCKVAVRWED